MTAPLLTTKLYIPPPRPNLVPRPRLIQRLDEGLRLGHKLILISAPAGFGKTTLLSEWIHSEVTRRSPSGRSRKSGVRSMELSRSDPASTPDTLLPTPYSLLHTPQVAWLSLDDGDNDPARFWAYFIATLQTFDAGMGKATLRMLQSSQPPPVETLLTGLINEVAALVPDPASTSSARSFLLVLDDFHLIRDQQIHQGLIFLLDHLPPHMHLILSTRSDPPWPLARLRARGDMIELRQTDLRFTFDEVADFLNRVLGLGLPADNVAALVTRTEGWIAGLQMAALSMQDRDDRARFVQDFTGSNRYVLDYLVEEVLEQQHEHVQTFLLQTSILDRLTGPLCDTVLGLRKSANRQQTTPACEPERRVQVSASVGAQTDDLSICRFADLNGQETLEYLERANLFVVSLDDRRQWYRYHHLFADLLRQRLQQQVGAQEIATLHRRASEWYEHRAASRGEIGLITEAIRHALSAEDFERAAYLIDEHAQTLWAEGAQSTLLRWLDTLPDELVRSWPRLCIYHALVLTFAGERDAAERRLQAAERALGPPHEAPDQNRLEQQGMLAAVRTYVALFQGDVPAIIKFSEQALAHLPQENAMWRSMVSIPLGDARGWRGDMRAADRAYSEVIRVSEAAGNVYVLLLAHLKLTTNQWRQGRLQSAVEMLHHGLQLADESGFAETAMAGRLFAVWGSILYEWNALDEASRYLRKGAELCERGDAVAALGLSYLSLTRVLRATGDTAGAQETFQNLEKLAQTSDVPVWITNAMVAWKAGLWIEAGELEVAAQLLQERGLGLRPEPGGAQGQAAGDETGYLREVEYLALARLCMAQGRYEEATSLLERLLRSAEAGGRLGWVIAVSVLRALALQARGDVPQAVAALERALSCAEPEGYVRTFVDEGEPIRQLLRQAASRGISSGYVDRLLAALGDETREIERRTEIPVPSSSLRPASLVEPLSERELEVLRLLTTHLSSTEIADELFISVNTVRSHIKSIYAKLNVHRRRDAVQRARELELL